MASAEVEDRGVVTSGALKPYHFTSSWYQIAYLLAAESAHAALTGPKALRQDRLTQSATQAQNVIETAREVLGSRTDSSQLLRRVGRVVYALPEKPTTQFPRKVDPDLRKFLDLTVIPSTKVLLAGVQIDLFRVSSKQTGIRGEETPGQLIKSVLDDADDQAISYRVRYNLACYFARLAEEPVVKTGIPHGEDDTLAHLRDLAFKQLAKSVQGLYGRRKEGLTSWAWEDPTLRTLRPDPRFEAIIGKRKSGQDVDQSTSSLSELRIIGPYGSQLGKLEIRTTEELLRRGETAGGVRQLAEQLKVGEELVHRWLGVAELVALPGIEAAYANLLDAAGVSSRRELARRSAPALTELLANVNAALQLVERLPSRATVQAWIAAAPTEDE